MESNDISPTNNTNTTTNNLIPPSLYDRLPALVRNEIVRLPAQTQEEFIEEYKRKEKSPAIAYLLWLVGFQHAYVGKWGILVIYWLTIYGLLVWSIVDLFLIPSMVRNYNKDLAVDVLRNIKSVQSS